MSNANVTPKGFSTLEMLIAMTVIVLTMGAVILVSFSNQSILVDSARNSDALALAQAGIESIQTLARKDFKLVNPVVAAPNGDYTTAVNVETQPDLFTKKITSTVTWNGEHLRAQHVTLTSIVSDFENPIGADTCSSVLVGNWASPSTQFSGDVANMIGDSPNTLTISDVDAYLGKLYVAVSDTSVNTSKTFLTFDVTDPTSPVSIPALSIDNNASVAGIAAVRVAGSYAYAANAVKAFYKTGIVAPNIECTNSAGANKSCGQLQIISLSGGTASVAYTYQLPNVVGTPGQGDGNSLFYKDGYVYLGLTKTGSGPEFNIIDVHDPSAPALIGSYAVGAGVNKILVRGNYAYLGTSDNSRELIVLDVSNPALPTVARTYDAAGAASFGYGNALYGVGDITYVGRTYVGNGSEFFIASTTAPAVSLPILGSVDIGPNSGAAWGVYGLVVRDTLAFVATALPSSNQGKVQMYDISDPRNPTPYGTAVTLSGPAAALDCEGNYLYAATNNPRGQVYSIAP